MASLPVLSWDQGKKVGEAPLDVKHFDGKIAAALLHEVVWSYGQNRRIFTASTRVRSEVSGGGKKPWKQKGTGRARARSIRAPHWRGGGTIFGPHPKKIQYRISRKARLGALRSALNRVVKEDRMVIVDDFRLEKAKTKLLAEGLKRLGIGRKPLAVTLKRNQALELAGRNLPGFSARIVKELTAEDVALHHVCVIEEGALELLNSRLAVANSHESGQTAKTTPKRTPRTSDRKTASGRKGTQK